jgi:hypothetical protein
MKPYVLVDFPVHEELLSEYFSRNNIDFDFVAHIPDVPLIDSVHQQMEGKENVILIISPLLLKILFETKSNYHNFTAMVSDRIKVILYDGYDTLHWMTDLYSKESSEFISWINELKPSVLTDGIAGKLLERNFNGCDFVKLHDPFLHHTCSFPELIFLKKHDPNKDFLCLMSKYDVGRSHRDILNEKMITKDLIDHTVYKFKPRTLDYLNDLNESYSEKAIKGNDRYPGLPPVHFYNQTNLEIVAETFGGYDNDDTFFVTEKTTKPIAMKHPFMVLSNCNFLKNLRDLGFKTFGDHLDESYDTEQDLMKRVEIITDNLMMLKGSSMKLYNGTKEIRDHNHLNLQYQQGIYKTKLWNRMDEFWKNI